jgi:hydroxymethylglutaryl-CoA reductase (NADPH)
MVKLDRRETHRVKHLLEVFIKLRDPETKKPIIYKGEAIDISNKGLAVSTSDVLPSPERGLIEIHLTNHLESAKSRIKIQWRNDEKHYYGMEFIDSPENQLNDFECFFQDLHFLNPDRREVNPDRRIAEPASNLLLERNNRKNLRRISDVLENKEIPEKDQKAISRDDLLPKQKGNDHSFEAAKLRRNWLETKTGVTFKHIEHFSDDPNQMKGNIENFVGVAQIPIGIAGPLKINGQYAKGDFYVPMATTEGALVYTYSLGMQIATLSGGVTTRILKDETHISPLFTFDNLELATQFCSWLQTNFPLIKNHAEKTTRYGKLLRTEPIIFDKNVIVKFYYKTGDAMGLNMINFATEAACNFIIPIVKPKRFYLRSNFSSVKKVSSHNYSVGMGKTVVCDIVIPAKIVKRFFETTPQDIATYFNTVILSSAHAGMIGVNGHTANGLTAIFIACGQDVASIVDSHIGNSNSEVTPDGDLYVSLKLPNLVIGTVGGGTCLGSQRECLEILGCYGSGKVEKFAEIIAATALCGEISIGGSITNGRFVEGHKIYGRKTILRQI